MCIVIGVLQFRIVEVKIVEVAEAVEGNKSLKMLSDSVFQQGLVRTDGAHWLFPGRTDGETLSHIELCGDS